MRAAVIDKYGAPGVVRIAEVPTPVPRAEEVLVRVHAAAVTSGDARIRAARFPRGFAPFARTAFGFTGPRRKILGTTFSGVVEALGSRADGVTVGDTVCGMTGIRMGAHAEYVTVATKKLARKPPTVSHEDAAGLLFGGTTALFFLRDKASVGPGMSVLVNGASGAVGTNAVQLAKHFGATVIAVTSTANVALVTTLGADRVIDYTCDDLASEGGRFDAVLDTVGNISVPSGRRLLSPRGKLLLVIASLGTTIRARGNVMVGSGPESPDDFDLLLGLLAQGTLTVVHDQTYDLAEIVDAYHCVDGGHKRGNVIVRP